MKNFIFKSTDADLQKIVPILSTKIDILNSNVLYVTHQVDKILKLLQEEQTDKGLQKQVDEFYENDVVASSK